VGRIQAVLLQQRGQHQLALADLDPPVARLYVDLQTVGRVRMFGSYSPPLLSRKGGGDDQPRHLTQIVVGEGRSSSDALQVHLVGLAGVQPVSDVPLVDEPGADE
jgi:hypothetical protein